VVGVAVVGTGVAEVVVASEAVLPGAVSCADARSGREARTRLAANVSGRIIVGGIRKL